MPCLLRRCHHLLRKPQFAVLHVKDVNTVLHRLREAGVTIKLEKCTWFSDEVEYLGHIVRPGQLHVHNKNVDALKHAKFPTTKTQLKSFLGMCNVY